MIKELREKGLAIAEIARLTRRDRKTLRKYLRRGMEQPKYGPRALRARKIDPYVDYIRARLKACPQLTAMRLLREIRERGYPGGRSAVTEVVATIRPREATGFEHRFETPVGEQAQVDFAQFKVVFRDQPQNVQVVWLFSMVLGYCRYLFGRFVLRQNLETVVSCHVAAFAEFEGVPVEILYDRMKTAVLGEDEDGQVRYHPTLLDLAAHYGFRPRACAPYRAQTKGKVVMRTEGGLRRRIVVRGAAVATLAPLRERPRPPWGRNASAPRVVARGGARTSESFDSIRPRPAHAGSAARPLGGGRARPKLHLFSSSWVLRWGLLIYLPVKHLGGFSSTPAYSITCFGSNQTMGRIDLTGNKFNVRLFDIRMIDFENDEPVSCSVSYYVTQEDQDSSDGVALIILRDLPVDPDFNDLVDRARKELESSLRAMSGSLFSGEPMMAKSP